MSYYYDSLLILKALREGSLSKLVEHHGGYGNIPSISPLLSNVARVTIELGGRPDTPSSALGIVEFDVFRLISATLGLGDDYKGLSRRIAVYITGLRDPEKTGLSYDFKTGLWREVQSHNIYYIATDSERSEDELFLLSSVVKYCQLHIT